MVRARRRNISPKVSFSTASAARMGTSQSVVARLESGTIDARLSTLQRYAAAVGQNLELGVRPREERA